MPVRAVCLQSVLSSLFKVKKERQRTYKRNIEARSRNHCCLGKAKVLHILSVCL